MKITPIVKTVTCITYVALILLSIIILFCVFSSRYESFSSSSCSESSSCIELCSGSGSGSSPSGDGGSSPSGDGGSSPSGDGGAPSGDGGAPSGDGGAPSGDGGSSPSDSPENIICDAAGPTRTDWDGAASSDLDDAYNNTYGDHNNRGCARIEEGKCWKRNIYDPILNEQVYCKWVDGMCKTFQTCSGDAVNNRPQWLLQGTSNLDVDEDENTRPVYTGILVNNVMSDGSADEITVTSNADSNSHYENMTLTDLDTAFTGLKGRWLLIGQDNKQEVVQVLEVKSRYPDEPNNTAANSEVLTTTIGFKISRNPYQVPVNYHAKRHYADDAVNLLVDKGGDPDDSTSYNSTYPLLIW